MLHSSGVQLSQLFSCESQLVMILKIIQILDIVIKIASFKCVNSNELFTVNEWTGNRCLGN